MNDQSLMLPPRVRLHLLSELAADDATAARRLFFAAMVMTSALRMLARETPSSFRVSASDAVSRLAFETFSVMYGGQLRLLGMIDAAGLSVAEVGVKLAESGPLPRLVFGLSEDNRAALSRYPEVPSLSGEGRLRSTTGAVMSSLVELPQNHVSHPEDWVGWMSRHGVASRNRFAEEMGGRTSLSQRGEYFIALRMLGMPRDGLENSPFWRSIWLDVLGWLPD